MCSASVCIEESLVCCGVMVEWVELPDTMLPRRRDDEGSEGDLRPEDGGALFLFSRDGSAACAPLVSAVDESPANWVAHEAVD